MKIAVQLTITIDVETLQVLWRARTGRGSSWFTHAARAEAAEMARQIFIDSGSSGLDVAIDEARAELRSRS